MQITSQGRSNSDKVVQWGKEKVDWLISLYPNVTMCVNTAWVYQVLVRAWQRGVVGLLENRTLENGRALDATTCEEHRLLCITKPIFKRQTSGSAISCVVFIYPT
jgi:hypothetical protein